MKVTVFSDVHGNLPALELLLKREQDADAFIFLGDAVNYGPWSNECVDLITSLNCKACIRGNHEDFYLDGHYGGSNAVAKAFFEQCYPKFDRFEEIKQYLTSWDFQNFTFIHTLEGRNIYPDTPLSLAANFFIGHSHHQFTTESNGFLLHNPGSVGQNRRFINVVSYLNWYPFERQSIEMQNFTYDIEPLIQEMKTQKYPSICLAYYLDKAVTV